MREAAEFLKINFGNIDSSLSIVPFNRREVCLKAQHPQFIERVGLFAEIEKVISEQPLLVLHGPPGVGKSEAAIAYGNRHLPEYPVVWVINAETEDQIEQSYRDLADAFHLPISNENTLQDLEKKVFRKLENLDVPWLLIYDNLQDSMNFPQRGGKILITTNFVDRFPLYAQIEVPCFEKQEAITLMKKVTEEEESQAMRDLIAQLGCYPLVVAQIAQYIRMNPTETMQSVLDSIVEMDFTSIHPDQRYKANFREVFAKLLTNLPDLALNWLYIYSHLNPEKISCSDIEIWLQNFHQLKEKESKQKTKEILSVLVNRGLLRFESSTQTFSIHRLFQNILNEKEPESSCEEALDLLLKSWEEMNLVRGELKFPSLSDKFCANAVPIVNDPKFKTIPPNKQALFCMKIGEAKSVRSKHKEALEKYEQALEIQRKFLNPEHSDIEETLRIISYCFLSQDKYSEALKKMEEVLSIRKSVLKSDHPDIAKIIEDMATILRYGGEHQKAIKKYQQAIKIYKKSLPTHQSNIKICQCGIEMSRDCMGMRRRGSLINFF